MPADVPNTENEQSAAGAAQGHTIGASGQPKVEKELTIINKLGLHARASAKLTQLAAKYRCHVHLTRNNRRINAKSIMGVMMLAAGKGAKLTLEVEGPEAIECFAALEALINDKFGEGE